MFRKFAKAQIIVLIFTKYIKAEEDYCETPVCPRGKHVIKCACRSNTWSCEIYSDSLQSCQRCDLRQKTTEQVKDDHQGDYCVEVDYWWIHVIIYGGTMFVFFTICFGCRKNFSSCFNKCKSCQNGYEKCCTKIEWCFKCMVCYSDEKNTPLCWYRYCFNHDMAFKPFRPKENIHQAPNVQVELQQNQFMPQNQAQINAPRVPLSQQNQNLLQNNPDSQQNNLNGVFTPIPNDNQPNGPQNFVIGNAIPMTSKMSNNLPFDTINKPISGFEPQYTPNQNTGHHETYAVEYYKGPISKIFNTRQYNAPNIYSNQKVLDGNNPNYNDPVQNNPVMPSHS